MEQYYSNPYGYYESMKGRDDEARKKAYSDYAKNGGCKITPDKSTGEKLKEYYRRHGYM